VLPVGHGAIAVPLPQTDGWRWIVDAHREGRGYVVHSDELLRAFLELNAMRLRPRARCAGRQSLLGRRHDYSEPQLWGRVAGADDQR